MSSTPAAGTAPADSGPLAAGLGCVEGEGATLVLGAVGGATLVRAAVGVAVDAAIGATLDCAVALGTADAIGALELHAVRAANVSARQSVRTSRAILRPEIPVTTSGPFEERRRAPSPFTAARANRSAAE